MLLVINDAVENLLISASENSNTLLNTFSLNSLPIEADTLDARKPTIIALTVIKSAIASIFAPVLHK